jgi:hypothetical protein
VIDVLVQIIFELSACLDLNLRTLKKILQEIQREPKPFCGMCCCAREFMRCLSSSSVLLSVELLTPSKEVSLEVFISITICFPQRAHKYI